MLYSININQLVLAEYKTKNKKGKEICLFDFSDGAILNHIENICASEHPNYQAKRLVDDAGVWTWMDLLTVATELPLLGIALTTNSAVSRRLEKMVFAEFIATKTLRVKGVCKLFVRRLPRFDTLTTKVVRVEKPNYESSQGPGTALLRNGLGSPTPPNMYIYNSSTNDSCTMTGKETLTLPVQSPNKARPHSNNYSVTKKTQTDIEPIVTANTNPIVNEITRIYDFWQSQPGLIKHRSLSDKLKRAINARFTEGYSADELEQAISNYAVIYNGEAYFLSYAWTLDEFLQRALAKFIDLDKAIKSYSIIKPSNKQGVLIER